MNPVNPAYPSDKQGEHLPSSSSPSPLEERVHQQMHPGSSSPAPKKVPADYIWNSLSKGAAIAAIQAFQSSLYSIKVILFKEGDSYGVIWQNPFTRNVQAVGVDEIPTTTKELEDRVRTSFREAEKEQVAETLDAHDQRAATELEAQYNITKNPFFPHSPFKKIAEKLDLISTDIQFVSPVDMSAIDKKAEEMLLALKSVAPIEEKKENLVRQQLIHSLVFVEVNRQELFNIVQYRGEHFYIPPSKQGFLKKGPYKEGASYGACHIYFCLDGTVFLIPKNFEFTAGQGTFKTVRLALEESSKKIFALASVRSDPVDFKREVDFLKSIQPQSVWALVYTNHKTSKGKLISLYAKYGSMDKVISTHSPLLQLGKKALMMLIIQQVISLHEKGIICHDIKGANILFGEDNGKPVAWIFDLGKARFTDKSTRDDMCDCTPYAMAPEGFALFAYQKMGIPSTVTDSQEKVDIYALGITLFDLMQGRTEKNCHDIGIDPLPWCSTKDQLNWYLNGDTTALETYKQNFINYGASHPEWALPEIIDATFSPTSFEQIVAWATHWDPQQRPSAEVLLESLRNVDI